jgi:uncharacterized membrane protein
MHSEASDAAGLPHVDDGDASPAENRNLERIAELLPPDDRAQLYSIIKSHSGWLPPPGMMRDYEDVLPGLAERIVAMPEREQAFRHGTTGHIVDRDYKLRSTGQYLGIAALVLILAFCVFLTVAGHAEAAAWVAGVTIVGTVGVFVTGQVIGNSSSSSKDVVESDE